MTQRDDSDMRLMTAEEREDAATFGWTCVRCSEPGVHIRPRFGYRLCEKHAEETRRNQEQPHQASRKAWQGKGSR